MNIEWNSEENKGQYPRTWNSTNFNHQYNEIEELIISRSRQKLVERAQREKLMPRERLMKSFYGDAPDRLPVNNSFSPPVAVRMFDCFGETPPVVHNRDYIEFPELQVLSLALWYARFQADMCFPISNTFGEEVVTKKFRLIEHGPPLAVEGFAKTKEDMEWFLDNVPDPGHRGIWPLTIWTTKQCMNLLPEIPTNGSCCAGPLAMATFFRGPREFLTDVRKNPEMADLTLKCVTKFFLKKLDRMAECLGPVFSPDNPNGHILFWCDGGGAYLTLDEFKRTWDLHYGTTIPHCAKKGINPYVAPVAGKDHLALIIKCMDENVGGMIADSDEVPPIEDGFPVWEKRDKKENKTILCCGPQTRNVLNGEEATRKDLLRYASLLAKSPERGLRAFVGGAADANTPLQNLDMMTRLLFEIFKYPVTVQ